MFMICNTSLYHGRGVHLEKFSAFFSHNLQSTLDLLTSRAFERVARSYERGARASEREARASESSTCFPCSESLQVTSFWRELLMMLHAALPVKLLKYFSQLATLINGSCRVLPHQTREPSERFWESLNPHLWPKNTWPKSVCFYNGGKKRVL